MKLLHLSRNIHIKTTQYQSQTKLCHEILSATEAVSKSFELYSTIYAHCTAWIDQNGQNETMAFLACLFDAIKIFRQNRKSD